MILGDDDIKAIADEVMRRLVRILKSTGLMVEDSRDSFAVQRELEILRQKSDDWIAKKERLDNEIEELSKKLLPELRPVPAQYKSIPGKEHVLELVKDPDRWAEIPLLPVQWPSRKKEKPAD